ncbi:unnamed protein product [Clonostachys rosea]|uniref:Uncharacterized protein n=1 Tax=Bionectria ochroleuca TaxID=29856 RepID=A0ABY6V4Z0_BIOOC|nr:unnamed protein product [Clonostachys rosea]
MAGSLERLSGGSRWGGEEMACTWQSTLYSDTPLAISVAALCFGQYWLPLTATIWMRTHAS